MGDPGWYPDPAGTGGERYWDGSEWATTVRRPPSVGDDAGAYATRARQLPRPLRLALVVAATLLTLALTAGALAWAATRDAKPTVPPSTFTPVRSQSSTAPAECRGVTDHNPTGVASAAPRLSTRHVSLPAPPGWNRTRQPLFISDWDARVLDVTPEWFSVAGVGTVRKERFGSSLDAAGEAVIRCLRDSIYRGTTQTPVWRKTDPVQGRPAVWTRAEYRTSKHPGVVGDRSDILLLDTGDADRFTLVVVSVHLDADRLAQGDRLLNELQVS